MHLRARGNACGSWIGVIAVCSVACSAERSIAKGDSLQPGSAVGGEKRPQAQQGSGAPGGDTAITASPAPEPELITSGPASYWHVGELSEVADRAPDMLIDEGNPLQEWLGFGGTFNEAGWDALLVVDASERARAMRLLFDDREGARFSYGRIPIGASDFAMDRYTLAEQPNDYALSSFSIDRDRRLLIPYVKAALAVKPSLNLWASPWTPPAWMKVNNSTDGGRIRDEPRVLDAYARYFVRFVEAYGSEGVTIQALHPQNEPGYEQSYPTCLWTPELLRDFIGQHLGPTLVKHGVTAEIWLGTMSAPGDTQHVTVAMADADASRFVRGIGLQWNLRDAVPGFASSYGLPIMQTEHRCGNYPWAKAKFNASQAPNDHTYAEESWRDISEWIRAGVNAYSAWNMVLDGTGRNMDDKRPWPQNALLVVDRAARTLTATPAYYVFRHLSQFVDPGAHRLATKGEGDALAFANPDGSIVVVLYNAADASREMTLAVRSSRFALTVPAHGWATVNSSSRPADP
jgi:glucosylceramidase